MPIGVIAIIFESRPNVTIDAAVLCLKTGNATVLRGGKEAIHSNRALIAALGKCMSLPKGAVQLIDNVDRASGALSCASQSDTIDLIIPRGGHALIETVVAESRIPVIKHAHGVCSVFVHEKADFAMAEKIILNAKVQRPGVCAMRLRRFSLIARLRIKFVPQIGTALAKAGVEIRGDQETLTTLLKSRLENADDKEFLKELGEARARHDGEGVSAAVEKVEAEAGVRERGSQAQGDDRGRLDAPNIST